MEARRGGCQIALRKHSRRTQREPSACHTTKALPGIGGPTRRGPDQCLAARWRQPCSVNKSIAHNPTYTQSTSTFSRTGSGAQRSVLLAKMRRETSACRLCLGNIARSAGAYTELNKQHSIAPSVTRKIAQSGKTVANNQQVTNPAKNRPWKLFPT